MDVRAGSLFLLVLSTIGTTTARQMPSNLPAMPYHHIEKAIHHSLKAIPRNEEVCTLCEEYTEMAIDYMSENKTQTEIIDLLHVSCSQLLTFKTECIALVDYYAPLFFLEISSIQPEEFCEKVNLCSQTRVALIASKLREDSCDLCHQTVSDALEKLKDPDTQMDIIQLLLRACNSMDSYAKKCKKMVSEYGPLVLANAEQFLESNDICTAVHACNESSTTVISNEASSLVEGSAVADS